MPPGTGAGGGRRAGRGLCGTPPRSPRAARLLLLLVMVIMVMVVGARTGTQATSGHEHGLNPNSSLWDMDYRRLLHSKKTLSGTMVSYKPSSYFRSSSLLSYHGRRSLLSQNLNQKPQEKQLSCDMLLKLSRYILMDIFRPSLAWNLFRFHNCDQEVNLPKIHISLLKVAQHKVKPFLLHRVLRLLGNMGVVFEAQQSKAFSLLKKQMIKPRKTPSGPEEEQSGRYTRRRCGFGISFWCCLSGIAGPGITGCNPVVWSMSRGALGARAEQKAGRGVLIPGREGR
ncbi:uncharacterized protein LOC116792946 [Chiroxiphia lanceolata]|uniref:uncharacterized protein LOC116792946 n=1 Tax=Chiroxiphia lanceolata TaxID=296741 RepID=UPI0013CEF4D3|nr:uncharacterized protein LOC116792946 [Chiroxiphia lanceolata]